MAMEYLLQFAGIPFVADTGKVIRIPHTQRDEYVNSSQRQPKTEQPEGDLLDEIQRKIPLHYLQDFALPGSYPGRNLGALAKQFQVGPLPSPDVHIGDWYYPTTASRWSVFRGLATSSMVKAMVAAAFPVGTQPGTTQGIAQTFTMMANPISPSNPGNNQANYTLTSQMYMLPPRPLAEHGGAFDGLYLVTLVDERYYWQFSPVTLRLSQNLTWQTLINQLASVLGVTITNSAISASYTQPEVDSEFWTNQESAAFLLDAVAFNIGCTVVRLLNGTYLLQTPTAAQTQILANRGNVLQVVRTAGGDIFTPTGTKLPVGNLQPARNAVVIPSVNVTFPKYVTGNDPVPHFVNPRYISPRPSAWYEESFGDTYVINVPITSGGPTVSGLKGTQAPPAGQLLVSGLEFASGFSHAIHTTAKALMSGEIATTPLNASGLTALAMQLAQDYYNGQVASALDEVYPGTQAWVPEAFHDIVWTYSPKARQACTRVMRSEWNQIVREMQHATPALSGFTNIPIGVGGKSVAQSWRDSATVGGNTTLNASLTSGGFTATLLSANGFPNANRWRGRISSGRIDDETCLFEGVSGGISPSIVYRGIDGSIQQFHSLGANISQVVPNTSYGVNLVTTGTGLQTYPGAWTSGGIQEVVLGLVSNGVTTAAVGPVITQTAHGFTQGQAVYDNAGTWTLAKADAAGTLGVGLVSVIDSNTFYLVTCGLITGLSGLTTGYYYVSDTVAGGLTATEPSYPSYSNPILLALSSTTAVVLPYRPLHVNGGGGGGTIATTGTGTVNAVPKYTAASVIGNSSITDDGTTVSITELHKVVVTDTGTNTTPTIFTIGHDSSNTPLVGFGLTHLFTLGSATVADRNAAAELVIWNVATDASREASWSIGVYDISTLRYGLTFDATVGGANASLFTAGNTTNYQSSVGALYFPKATTNPSGNPSNGSFLFCDSTTGNFSVQNSSGTVTDLTKVPTTISKDAVAKWLKYTVAVIAPNFVITAPDGTTTSVALAAALTQIVTIVTPAVGSVVDNAGWFLDVSFTGGAVATCVGNIGDDVAATRYFSNVPLKGSVSTAPTYSTIGTVSYYTGGNTILQIAITTTGANVNALTAGKITIQYLMASTPAW